MRSVRSSLTPQSPPPPIAPIRSSDSSHSEWSVSPGQTQSGSNTVRQPLPSRCPRSLTSCWADKERHTVLSKTMLSCWETRNCFKPLLDRDPVFPFFPLCTRAYCSHQELSRSMVHIRCIFTGQCASGVLVSHAGGTLATSTDMSFLCQGARCRTPLNPPDLHHEPPEGVSCALKG